jgi:hypothetical protein
MRAARLPDFFFFALHSIALQRIASHHITLHGMAGVSVAYTHTQVSWLGPGSREGVRFLHSSDFTAVSPMAFFSFIPQTSYKHDSLLGRRYKHGYNSQQDTKTSE